MNGEQATAHVLFKLAELGIDHMLVGAFSSNAYGVPRATKDADIVVEFNDIQVAEFCSHLDSGFSLDRQMM